MAFCLSFPKWCNTYTLAEKIKALEHQTFSTHFTSKFMLFWITQKLTFFTHPNIKIGKNGNAPIHRRGFHVFFKNSWPSFTHLRPDIMALVMCFMFWQNMTWIKNVERKKHLACGPKIFWMTPCLRRQIFRGPGEFVRVLTLAQLINNIIMFDFHQYYCSLWSTSLC